MGRPSKVTRALASGHPALSDHVITATGWDPAAPCRGVIMNSWTEELSSSHDGLPLVEAGLGVAVGDGDGVALGVGVGLGFGVVLVGDGDGRGDGGGGGGADMTLKDVDVRLVEDGVLAETTT